MPYRSDLSGEFHGLPTEDAALRYVGWLDAARPFRQEYPSEETLDLLWRFSKVSVRPTRGYHLCEFCRSGYGSIINKRRSEYLQLGSAELWAFSLTGAIYAAPNLLYHYVAAHHYRPPDPFLQALRDGPQPPADVYFARLSRHKLDWQMTTVPALDSRLRHRWLSDVASLTGGAPDRPEALRLYESLVRSYSEHQRVYHILEHLEFLFARLDELAGDAEDKQRLAFAAWYHDVIYDPLASDNEERSALRAVDELTGLGAPEALVRQVASLIRATAAHTKGGADHDDNLFLDADFCILGAEPEAYRRYVAGVRREYAHVDDAGWRTGRGAFLKNALNQPRIFRTDRFETAYGPQARANMADELADLTQP